MVGLPDRLGREAILRMHALRIPLDATVRVRDLARETPGFSGADLANLVNEAALSAARRQAVRVESIDFEQARDRIELGSPRGLILEPDERRRVAVHEAGHALVAWHVEGLERPRKVSIVPRGQALGMTALADPGDRSLLSKGQLMARMAVLLAGRAAEELVTGEISSGAEADLVGVTRLATRMVWVWGMAAGLPPRAYPGEPGDPTTCDPGSMGGVGSMLAEVTRERLDEAIAGLIEEAGRRARSVLAERRFHLEQLVDALLEEEVLDSGRLQTLLSAS
jgi:cell division protease FtsH